MHSKQALLLTLGEMGSAQDEALGARDSQGQTQHDLICVNIKYRSVEYNIFWPLLQLPIYL